VPDPGHGAVRYFARSMKMLTFFILLVGHAFGHSDLFLAFTGTGQVVLWIFLADFQ
jgi:hypothetical protein